MHHGIFCWLSSIRHIERTHVSRENRCGSFKHTTMSPHNAQSFQIELLNNDSYAPKKAAAIAMWRHDVQTLLEGRWVHSVSRSTMRYLCCVTAVWHKGCVWLEEKTQQTMWERKGILIASFDSWRSAASTPALDLKGSRDLGDALFNTPSSAALKGKSQTIAE